MISSEWIGSDAFITDLSHGHGVTWGEHVYLRPVNNVGKCRFWEADDFISFLEISDMGFVPWNNNKKKASYHKKCVCADVNENQLSVRWSFSANVAFHSPLSGRVFYGDVN